MANTLESNITDATCQLCNELYTDPLLLPCLHSFCKKCLVKFKEKQEVSDATITCPSCDEVAIVPSNSVLAFPQNFWLAHHAEEERCREKLSGKEDILCERCVPEQANSSAAVVFCCECCEFLCATCKKDHQRWRATVRHELMEVGEMRRIMANKKFSIPRKERYCSRHTKEVLSFYCKTCEEIICRNCVILNHKDHLCGDLDEDELADNSFSHLKTRPSTTLTKRIKGKDDKTDTNIVQQYNLEEKIAIRSVKCFLTGLPGIGKTTFLRRVSEDIVNLKLTGEESCSSTGLEAPLPVYVPDDTQILPAMIRDFDSWKIQRSNEDSAAVMIELFRSKPRDLAVPEATKTAPSTTPPIIGHTRSTKEVVGRQEVDSVSVETPRPQYDQVSQYIEHVLESKGISSVKQLQNMSMVYFIDTGGQPEFHEILPVILRGSALYLVFFSLAHELHKKVHVSYRLPTGDGRSSAITYDAYHSSIEMIHQLLSSFYSIHSREVENQSTPLVSIKSHSVAVLLATYADHLEGEDKQEKLAEINRELEEWLKGCEFDKKFLTYSRSSQLIFTPIDNMNGSKEEITDVERFLTPIINSFPEVNLPRTLFLFHLILQHKFKESGVCSTEEAIQLGSGCGIKESDVKAILQYFHKHLGTILFYSEVTELQGIVICDPNILFKCIIELIMESFAGARSYVTHAELVRETGEISSEVIEEFQQILDSQSLLKTHHVICLLKHFKLLEKMEREGEVVYFMPCLLYVNHAILSTSYQAVSSSSQIPSLLIRFKGGYIPVGMFSALVVTLTTSHGWELDRRERYRNSVKFQLNQFVLKLVVYPSFLEIRACLHSDSNDMVEIHEECLGVRKIILEAISDEVVCCKTKFNLGYFCSGSKDSTIPLHACLHKTSGKIVCDLPRCHHYDWRKNIDNNQQIWFEEWKVQQQSTYQGTSTTPQVSAAISGHTSTSASTTGGTTSGDGAGASTTTSQDSTIAVQQPAIDGQYPLLDEGDVNCFVAHKVLQKNGPKIVKSGVSVIVFAQHLHSEDVIAESLYKRTIDTHTGASTDERLIQLLSDVNNAVQVIDRAFKKVLLSLAECGQQQLSTELYQQYCSMIN